MARIPLNNRGLLHSSRTRGGFVLRVRWQELMILDDSNTGSSPGYTWLLGDIDLEM